MSSAGSHSEIRKRVSSLIFAILAAVSSLLSQGAYAENIKLGTPLDYTYSKYMSTVYHQGQKDYATYINDRGGINGRMIEFLGGEHSNKAELGISEYRRIASQGALTVDPLSTIVSKSISNFASADRVNLLTIYSGASNGSDGSRFPYVFPMSATYWSQAALLVDYFNSQKGGIAGKTVAFIADSSPEALGMSTLPFIEHLSEILGFRLVTNLYPRTGDRSATLAKVPEMNADWIIVWDGGPRKLEVYKYLLSHGVAAQNIGTLVWFSEPEIASLGEAAVGIMKFEGVASGKDAPLVSDVVREVVEVGKGSGDVSNVGSTPYNVGVASLAIVEHALRLASADTSAAVTGVQLHDSLERIREFNANGLMPPMTITSTDHQGGGVGRVVRWNGLRWVPVTEWGSAYQDLVWAFIKKS